MTTNADAPQTKGFVIRSGVRAYDVLAWVLTLGREKAFRSRLVELARISPGEIVLDVGCGTGSQAIAAKRRVGPEGTVIGIDASPEMIERARSKATRAGVDAAFEIAIIEALPFPNEHFDVVLSTLMVHHLPRAVREQGVREMRRVLRSGGRLLVVDFATPPRERKGLFATLHRHGGMKPQDIIDLLEGAGLPVVASGSTGVADVHYVLATPPEPGTGRVRAAEARSLDPLSTPRWMFAALLLLAIAIPGALLGVVWSRVALSLLALIAVVFVVIVMHLPLARRLHRGR